jgi:hypothetical protein
LPTQVLDSAGEELQHVLRSGCRTDFLRVVQLGAPLEQARVTQSGQRLAQGGVG